jgi:hypothetical protein
MVNNARRRSHDHNNRTSAKDTRVKATAKPDHSMKAKAISEDGSAIGPHPAAYRTDHVTSFHFGSNDGIVRTSGARIRKECKTIRV